MVEKTGHGADYYKHLARLHTQLIEPANTLTTNVDFNLAEQLKRQFQTAMPHHLIHLSQAGIILSLQHGNHPLVFDEVVGQPLSDWLAPTSATKLSKFLDSAASPKGPLEIDLVSLHGEEWQLIILKRITDNDSLDFLCSLSDKSAAALADEILARLGTLESAALITDQLAHDLNNKLTVLLGTLSLLNIDEDRHESCAEHLKTMMEATMESREILTLLQKRQGVQRHFNALDLTQLIQQLADTFNKMGFTIFTELPQKEVFVSGNAAQLIISLSNIILNALEADEKDPVTISAELVTVDDESPFAIKNGPAVNIWITDNGPGIRDKQASSIFQPFFSTKRGSEGLGLPVARTAIKQHGGELYLLHNGQHGCTFQIVLPTISEPSIPPGKPSSPKKQKKKKQPAKQQPLHILLLDDDPFILEVTTEMLSALGHTSVAAVDCDEAVAQCKEELSAGRKIDLAILDIVIMNGPGGEEVFHELRAIDPDLRAIASSGQSTNPIMLNPTKHGFLAALPKPYSVSDISQALALVGK